MPVRRASRTEPEVVKEKPATSGPVIAGILRSGRKRLGQLADFESSVEPTAGSLEENLPGNQLVGTADPLESVLPAQTGMSASNGGESEDGQVAGGSNNSQQTEEVHSDQARDSVTSGSDLDSERSWNSISFARSGDDDFVVRISKINIVYQLII